MKNSGQAMTLTYRISSRCRETEVRGQRSEVRSQRSEVRSQRSEVNQELVMPRQKTTLSELRVGILVVATITILIIFILGVSGGIPIFQHNAKYSTRLAAAEGLKKGDEVRLAGKLIGKVDTVDFGAVPVSKDEKPIVITMIVDAKEVDGRIRRDSQAV